MVVPGGKPIIFFTILALIDEGDEVIYPNPGFPIYESMINYVGGRAVPIQLREERDFSPRRRTNWPPDQRPHPADHSELAAESHGRRARAHATSSSIARSHRRSQHHGPLRRDLQPPALRRRAALLHHVGARNAGAHHPARWLLEDLRHDRMAHGLRRDACGPGRAHDAPDDEFELLHGELHAGRRDRGNPRRSDFGRPYATTSSSGGATSSLPA